MSVRRSNNASARELAASLLASKGRSASVASEAEDGRGPVVTRNFRSISNQIEEDAVNGLLADLMSPIVSAQNDSLPQETPENASVAVSQPSPKSSPKVAHQLPPPKTKKAAPEGDSSDEGVSDSSEETAAPKTAATTEALKRMSDRVRRDLNDSDEETFFPDEMASPQIRKKHVIADEPAAQPKKEKAPPPAELTQQVSQLSWIDYLRQECPVCAEMREADSGGTQCGPCGKRVCNSCVQVFRQEGPGLYVRVCPRCRDIVPEDGVEVCGGCTKTPLDDSSQQCSECRRLMCGACVNKYVLRSLGETEPRNICTACVGAVQLSLSALQNTRGDSSAKPTSSPRINAAASPRAGISASPRRLDKSKSEGSFWRMRSPRRSEEPASRHRRRPSLGKSKTSSIIQKRNTPTSEPFPGVKLYEENTDSKSVPETIARRGSRPTPVAPYFGAEGGAGDEDSDDEGEEGRTVQAMRAFTGEADRGELDVRAGERLIVFQVENGHARVEREDGLRGTVPIGVIDQSEETLDREMMASLRARVLRLESEPLPAASAASDQGKLEGSAQSDVVPASASIVIDTPHAKGKKLVAAVRANEPGKLLQALDDGADPDWKGARGETALLTAARLGMDRIKCVRLLLERGANPNVQTANGWTALHYAVKDGGLDMATLLRSNGAKCDIMNEWMKSALDMARDKNDDSMVALLTGKAPKPPTQAPSPPVLEKLEELEPVEMADDDEESQNEEQEAVSGGEPAKMEEGVKPSSPSLDGSLAPMEEAATPPLEDPKKPDQAVVEETIEQTLESVPLEEEVGAVEGPDPNAISTAQALADLESLVGTSLPPRALKADRPQPPSTLSGESVGLMTRPEERPPPPTNVPVPTSADKPFRDGPTKSVIAARPKKKVRNPNRRSTGSEMVRSLVAAARDGDVPQMKALLAAGCPLNSRCPATGNTPLISAVLGGANPAIMHLLRCPGINLNTPNRAGDTVLHVLAATGNIDAAVWLIQRGADLNARNAAGQTPVQMSSELAAKVQAIALGE